VGPHKADTLWMDQAAVAFVWDFIASGRPVEVICHGPSTLVKADVVRGRTITSYPSVATDLRHSRASWIDQEVIAHGNLIGSRNPGELPTSCTEVIARPKAARSLAGRHDSRGMGHQEP
jgi:protease I